MLNTAQLHDALTGIIGLNDSMNSELQSIDVIANRMRPDLSHRQASLMLSDAHKLLRVEILSALGPNLLETNPVFFDANTVYSRYEIVQDGTGYLESRIDGNDRPVSDQASWRPTTLLSAWVRRIERGAINKLALLAGFNPPPSPLMEPLPLYQKGGNLQDTVSKLSRFVGIRLSLRQSDINVGIRKIGLQFSGLVNNLPVYLFRSDMANPVKVLHVTTTIAGRMQWFDVGELLYSSSNDVYFEGEYYLIGYFEDDLPLSVNAIDGQRSLTVADCSSCNPYDVSVFNSREPYVLTESVYVDNVGNSRQLSWPLENRIERQTWGINLILDAGCDVTRALIEHKQTVLRALLYQMAYDALEELSTSDRVNGTAEKLRDKAYVAINGQGISNSDTGIKPLLKESIKDFKTLLAAVAPRCFPVNAAPTITFESF